MSAPKKKDLKRSASAAAVGAKKKASVSKRQGTISIDGPSASKAAMSAVKETPMPPALQDMHNIEEQLVELDHLRTLNIEVDRERGVTLKVQSDVEMLRKQLARADEHNKSQEKVRI